MRASTGTFGVVPQAEARVRQPPPEPLKNAHGSRGGFFRGLGKFRVQLHEEQYPHEVKVEKKLRKHVAKNDEIGHQERSAAEARTTNSKFLQMINSKFLYRLWVAIKKNAMHQKDDNYRTIKRDDFLRLFRETMGEIGTEEERQKFEFISKCIFDRVDRHGRGAVRTTDVATALVVICGEPPLTKLDTMFRIFDADDDSCLTHDQIFDMYLSIKVNDITKMRQALVADITFDEELSLQEAKRLYERTIKHLYEQLRLRDQHLSDVSDFVIFEEFSSVFRGRDLLKDLLPGAFSLDWILQEYQCPNFEQSLFSRDILREPPPAQSARRRLVDALRHGEEHLELGRGRGRGTRVKDNCRNVSSKPLEVEMPNSARPRSLPQLTRANSRRSPRSARGPTSQVPTSPASASRRDTDDSSEDSDDSDLAPSTSAGWTRTDASPRASGMRGTGQSARNGTYSMQDALDLPSIQVLNLNHNNSRRFRDMMLDTKSQQAYLRDKKGVNRTQKYQCLVCAADHHFRLSKSVTSAEHQHVHG